MAEFHDLAELALNSDGESWGNLGYWPNATNYSDACRALALLLGEQAVLDHRSSVFDAGFGCGDQLLLWLDHFHVGPICGVNLSRSQTVYAKRKLEEAGHPDSAAAISQGDINDPKLWDAALGRNQPSHVLAVDCAYHFPSRVEFFAVAQRHLASSGQLALTDFMLSGHHDSDGIARHLLRWMLKVSRIPEANIVDWDRYRLELEQSGFADMRMIDISAHVMPGLAQFIRRLRQGKVAAGISKRPGWAGLLKYRLTGRFLEWAHRRSILRYCLIIATKAG